MTTNPTRSRSEVPVDEQWNLSVLFVDDEAWEKGLEKYKNSYQEAASFEGRLAESAGTLKEFLDAYFELNILSERLGYYALLRMSEDQGDSDGQSRQGRYMQVAAAVSASLSFADPEIQSIPDEQIQAWIKQDDFANYRIFLKKTFAV